MNNYLKNFSDNVTLNIDGILYLVVKDPYKASYGVEDPGDFMTFSLFFFFIGIVSSFHEFLIFVS